MKHTVEHNVKHSRTHRRTHSRAEHPRTERITSNFALDPDTTPNQPQARASARASARAATDQQIILSLSGPDGNQCNHLIECRFDIDEKRCESFPLLRTQRQVLSSMTSHSTYPAAAAAVGPQARSSVPRLRQRLLAPAPLPRCLAPQED